MSVLEVSGKNIALTEEGYLENFADWNKDVAEALAKQEGIELTDNHWKVIEKLQKNTTN